MLTEAESGYPSILIVLHVHVVSCLGLVFPFIGSYNLHVTGVAATSYRLRTHIIILIVQKHSKLQVHNY